jgi:menaquinol-cytochrome c reductase iron-sulfur subunit
MDDTPRRGFLQVLAGLVSAGLAAAVGIPIVGAFFDPEHRRTVTGGEDPQDYGKVTDLPVGTPRRVEVVATRVDAWDRAEAKPLGAIWLVRRDDTHVDAYTAACPHLGCAIDYDPAGKKFGCPCHDSAFALANGERLKGPSPRGLDPLPVEIKDGRVHVTLVRFIQGISSRQKM